MWIISETTLEVENITFDHSTLDQALSGKLSSVGNLNSYSLEVLFLDNTHMLFSHIHKPIRGIYQVMLTKQISPKLPTGLTYDKAGPRQ